MAAYTDYNQIYRRLDSDPGNKVYGIKTKFEGSKGEKEVSSESRAANTKVTDRNSHYSDYMYSKKSDYSDSVYSKFDSKTSSANNNNTQRYSSTGSMYTKPYNPATDRNVISGSKGKCDKPNSSQSRENSAVNARKSRLYSDAFVPSDSNSLKIAPFKVSELTQHFVKSSEEITKGRGKSSSVSDAISHSTNYARDRFLSDTSNATTSIGPSERRSRNRTPGSRQIRGVSLGRTPRERERIYRDGDDENLSRVAAGQRLFETLDVAQPIKKPSKGGRKDKDTKPTKGSIESEKLTDISSWKALLRPRTTDKKSATKESQRVIHSGLRNSSETEKSKNSIEADKSNLYGRQKLYTPLPVRRSAEYKKTASEQKATLGVPLKNRRVSGESDKSALSPTCDRNSIAGKQQLFETRISDLGKTSQRTAMDNNTQSSQGKAPYKRASSHDQFTTRTGYQQQQPSAHVEKNPYKALPKRMYVKPTPAGSSAPEKFAGMNDKAPKSTRPTNFSSRAGRFEFESSIGRAMSDATSCTSSTVTTPCTPTPSTPDYDYENNSVLSKFKGHIKRTGSKPPASIVAKRTQMFEKSIDETGSVNDEHETYDKMKELGTAFKLKTETTKSSIASPAVIVGTTVPLKTTIMTNACTGKSGNYVSSRTSLSQDKKEGTTDAVTQGKHANGKVNQSSSRSVLDGSALNSKDVRFHKNSLYAGLNIHSKSAFEDLKTKFVNKSENGDISNGSQVKNTAPNLKTVPGIVIVEPSKNKVYPKIKPLPDSIKSSAVKVSRSTGPPKPPRTFEFTGEKLSPRSDGDGQESSDHQNHGYEVHMKRPDSPVHAYTPLNHEKPEGLTSVVVKDQSTAPSAANTGKPEGYAKEHGSGGDESVYSENAYDTLGGSSNHSGSHYDQYDTISLCQSEFDEDFRPPTLPRRPSHLRHRPLTTAFSSLDLRTSTADRSEIGKLMQTGAPSIKESPTGVSPTKGKGFKLKYLLPRARRKADELRKAQSVGCLLDEEIYQDVGYNGTDGAASSNSPPVQTDQAGYAVPDNKGGRKTTANKPSDSQQQKKPTDKIRTKLNHAFSALRRSSPASTASTPLSDGEEEEKPPDAEVMEQRLKHCNSVKERAIYASSEYIRQFLSKAYSQLYDYAVIVSLRKNPDTNLYEPFVKFTFPPQVDVEQTAVPQFCFPDAHIWHKVTEYKSEAFSFVLTDVTGTRQYGYCRRVLPPDLNNLPRMAEVLCIVSPLNAVKLYNQVLDEVEKRRCQNAIRAEEFLQAVYGRPMPSPGQSVTIRATDLEPYESLTNVYEESESLTFTRSADSQREGVCFECLLNFLSINKIIKIFASVLLERKIIFIADKLNTLSACVHAFVSLIYPFSWQHTFIPLLPPNLIDVVCAPTPFIVGILSANAPLLSTLDGEMEEVLIVDLDNHKLQQRIGDEKSILPKQLFRSLANAFEIAKSENTLKNLMISETFLRFFMETVGSFNQYMIKGPGGGKQFQQEEFVCNPANAPSVMIFLQWFTETQMFEVYKTEKESEHGVITGTFEERLLEWKYEDHDYNDNKKKKFKFFRTKGKKRTDI